MKLTIVASDKSVGIDGEHRSPLNLAQLDPAIHAVQWHDDYGEVEYKTRFENGIWVKPENTRITDISPFQFAVDAFNAGVFDAEQPENQATQAMDGTLARYRRNSQLAESDWAVLPDSPLDPVARAAWVEYRHLLRGVPQQPGFPTDIIWPISPALEPR